MKNPTTVQVQRCLSRLDNMHDSKMELIAQTLGIAAQPLSLKLKGEGTMFSDLLLAERKRRFFNALIDNRAITAKQMAQVCGIAGATGMYQCLKRWTDLNYEEAKRLSVPQLRTVLWFRQGASE